MNCTIFCIELNETTMSELWHLTGGVPRELNRVCSFLWLVYKSNNVLMNYYGFVVALRHMPLSVKEMAFSENERSSLFLVLLSLILISSWNGCWGALFPVKLREATVIASSTCNNTELCVFRENNLLCQQCSFNQHQPGFAVDGDRNTTWSSPPTSELSSGRAQLEVHLNQVNNNGENLTWIVKTS